MVMDLTGGVEVRISGGTPLEVLAKLAAWGMRCYSRDSQIQELASQILKLEESLEFCLKDGPISSAPPADHTGPAAGENGPSAAPSEKNADPPAPASTPTSSSVSGKTDASIPTSDEVTVAGRKAAEKYGATAIKPILKEFGVSRISELAEKDRAAFIARLEGLSN